MGKHAVVAYPILSADDRQWIEGIRALFDPLASRIAPHFTLVFPTEVTASAVVAHVRNTLRSSESISVVLRRAAAYPDAIGSGYYVCLLAEKGCPELLAVHDTLYDNVLAAYRHPDIPFVPHVTVGAHPQLRECERIADRLNEERRIVRATIESVNVIEVDGSMVQTVAEIPLVVAPTSRRTAQCSGSEARVARPPAADCDR